MASDPTRQIALVGSALKVGYISCAQIGKKTWKAIAMVGGTVTALGSRDDAKAASYARECMAATGQIDTPALMSYDQVLALPNESVNVVYIGLPTGLRKEWVLKAARAKKHIVSEKPAATSLDDLREMLSVCQENNVQFMDGTMLSHGLRIGAVCNAVKSLGPVRNMTFTFSFNGMGSESFSTGNVRMKKELEPYGSLGDLGWYCVRYTLHVMEEHVPLSVRGRITLASEEGVPIDFSGELLYPDGIVSRIFSSFRSANQQSAIISCSGGSVVLNDFVLPFSKKPVGFMVSKHSHTSVDCEEHFQEIWETIAMDSALEDWQFQETNLWKNMGRVASGRWAPDPYWPRLTELTQRVVDALLKSSRENGVDVLVGN